MFTKAIKEKVPAKIMIEGFSGSGKTMGALLLAKGLAGGGKIAFLDTENRRSLYYANDFAFDSMIMRPPFSPEAYVQCINSAKKQGYSVLILDSITHEWEFCLDLQSQLGGRWQDWNTVTPRHNGFIEAIRQSDIHIISTVRSKVAYILEEKANKKKLSVQKAGTKALTRDGFEYENTIVFSLNANHVATITKGVDSLGKLLNQQETKLTEEHGKTILNWCNTGEQAQSPPNKEEVVFDMSYTFKNGEYKDTAIKDIKDVAWLSKWAASEKVPTELKPLLREQLKNLEGGK